MPRAARSPLAPHIEVSDVSVLRARGPDRTAISATSIITQSPRPGTNLMNMAGFLSAFFRIAAAGEALPPYIEVSDILARADQEFLVFSRGRRFT